MSPKRPTLRAVARSWWSIHGILIVIWIAGFFVVPHLVDRFVLVPSLVDGFTVAFIWNSSLWIGGAYQLCRYDRHQNHMREVIRTSRRFGPPLPRPVRARILTSIVRDRRLRAAVRSIGLRWDR